MKLVNGIWFETLDEYLARGGNITYLSPGGHKERKDDYFGSSKSAAQKDIKRLHILNRSKSRKENN